MSDWWNLSESADLFSTSRLRSWLAISEMDFVMAPIIYKPDPGPENLKDVLARMFTLRGWGRRAGRRHVEEAWNQALEAAQRERTRVLGLKRGVLEVEVNDSVLMQELSSFHRRRLLEVLKKSLPNENVRELRFRAGTW